MAQFSVALVLMLSLLDRNGLESNNLCCYAVRYKSMQAAGKQRDVGSRIIPHPDTAAKIRTDFDLTLFSEVDAITCDRVIKNSRAVLTFHRFSNTMYPFCCDFNNSCTDISQAQKDKLKSNRQKIHPVKSAILVSFEMF